MEPSSATPTEEGAAVAGVGEAGDGLDGGVLDELGLVALLDVPAEGGLVLEVEGLAVGAEQVADGAGLLVGDYGLFVDLGREEGHHVGL